MAGQEPHYDIFLAHAAGDKATARALYAALQAANLRVFFAAGLGLLAVAAALLFKLQGSVEQGGGGPAEGEERSDAPLLPLVQIPSGTFTMGSPSDEADRDADEAPQHVVTISALSMCETEVSQGVWEAVMGSNPSDCDYGCGAALPVQNVSWLDAVLFFNRLSVKEGLEAAYYADEDFSEVYAEGEAVFWKTSAGGYRLPTEAEWEHAARAATAYSFGADDRSICDYANLADASAEAAHPSWGWTAACDDGYANLAPIGQFFANDWGLYDMHGNVWEWVFDAFDSRIDELERVQDPYVAGYPGAPRILRGGSFSIGAWELRSAYRIVDAPSHRMWNFGLRCVRGAHPQP